MNFVNRRLKIGLISILFTILVFTGGFLYYASDYYPADDLAMEVLKGQDTIRFQEDYIVLTPTIHSDTGLIFYPGAKVEYYSYLPILEKIKDGTGISCILVKMPFNMAIFDVDRADEIMDEFPDIKKWYIGGHSMGGAMASNYAAKNQDKLEGLILLASYIYGDYPDNKTLTIYGTLNTSVWEKIDYEKNIIAIQGGNHAQFGNYGKQKGDAEATISREEQQDITVEAINRYLQSNQ